LATIRLPNNWSPRNYQRPAWLHMEQGGSAGKRLMLFWHRRSGKDDICLHFSAVDAMQHVIGIWHMLPSAEQARKAIWNAVNPKTGLRRIDEVFPVEMRETTRDQDMFIRFVNGSTWQAVGSDNFNSLVGSPPGGVVFSEFALSDPRAWAYIRPILAENNGWAMFNTTSRGKNHAYRMLQGAKDDTSWFTQILPATETDVFTTEQLTREKSELCREYGDDVGLAMFNQEYLCSFEEAVVGAIYAPEMQSAFEEKRLTKVVYEREIPVFTFWDIGIGDSTAIWLMQQIGREIHLIDYIEDSGKDIAFYVNELNKRPYVYDEDWLPHDAQARELGTGKSIEEMLRQFNRRVKITPRLTVEEGINAARMLLSRCWFDVDKCSKGIDAMQNYRRDYVEKMRELRANPVHDWSSHGADAFRYLAVAINLIGGAFKQKQTFSKENSLWVV
jgi:phage terminase large subunit